MNNITNIPVNKCCGCGVCVYKCPKKIIELRSDNEGFLYPKIIDSSLCINCGLCLGNCPVNNRKNSNTINYDTPKYAYHPDSSVCQKSASGGIAAGLYRGVISRNGIGFGVSYIQDFTNAEYIKIEDDNSIQKACGSKYIKASANGVYESIYKELMLNRMVLVIALPCEIAAIHSYLGKDYPNLYMCELICHGPTSNLVLRDFVTALQKVENSRIVSFNQRAKKPFWKPYYLDVHFENGHVISRPFVDSDFEKAFQIMKRPSCNFCVFKDGKTYSDLIIGDFHGAKKQTEEYNKFGVSICFPCTQKGIELIEILKELGFVVGAANIRRAKGNRALHEPIPQMGIRKRFVKKFINKGLSAAANDPIVNFSLKKRKFIKRIKSRLK